MKNMINPIPTSYDNGRNYTPDCLVYRNELFAPRQTATVLFPFDSSELYMFADPRHMERFLRTEHSPVLLSAGRAGRTRRKLQDS
jgi:hypothetical protein